MAIINVPIAVGTDDDYVRGTGATYATVTAVGYGTPANDFLFAVRSWHTGTSLYRIYEPLLRFNTGANLPDNCYINSVSLDVRVSGIVDGDARSVSLDYFNWSGSSFAADWVYAAQTTANAGIAMSTMSLAVVSFPLLNVDDNISKTGTTGLRMHVMGGDPGLTDNTLTVSSYEHLTHPAPSLTIDYTDRTALAPDAILSQTNLTGTVADIDEDPSAPDANWLVAP